MTATDPGWLNDCRGGGNTRFNLPQSEGGELKLEATEMHNDKYLYIYPLFFATGK